MVLVPLGLAAAGAEFLVAAGVRAVVDSAAFASSRDGDLFAAGLLAGGSFVLLFGVSLLLPVVWRRAGASARSRRALALVAVQCYAVGAGLLLGRSEAAGWLATFLLSCAGTFGWFVWQRKWRGSGAAPSLLTGIVRPPIAPGQVWYAYVPGRKETKIRPVIVLKPVESRRWVAAYLTSQEPHAAIDGDYVEVPQGRVRGLPRRSWVHVTDPRAMTRGRFRTYVGVAPRSLYEEACRRAGVRAVPADARTVEEERAGARRGPGEGEWRRSLGAGRDAGAATAWGADQSTGMFLRELWRAVLAREFRN